MNRENPAREGAQTRTGKNPQAQDAPTAASSSQLDCGRGAANSKCVAPAKLRLLQAALRHIDPTTAPYDRRFKVAAAISHETRGGIEGLDLFDEWLSRRPSYRGVEESIRRWRYLDPNCPRSYTLASIRRMVEDEGTSWEVVVREAAEEDAA